MTINPSLRPARSSRFAEPLKNFGRGLIPVLVCAGLTLALWQILCMSPDSKMPGPLRVIEQTWVLALDPFSVGDAGTGVGILLFASLQRVVIGYTLAAVVGIGLGAMLGLSRFAQVGFDPLIQILRTIPPLAWLPISLGIFQDARPAGIFLIFITAIWPIVINTTLGVQQIPQDYNNVAKVLKLSGKDYFFNILVPSTVPYVFGGLRIGIGLAWLAIVAAEMMTPGNGIGFQIWDSYNSGGELGMSRTIMYVFATGLVGLTLDRFVGWLGSRITSDH